MDTEHGFFRNLKARRRRFLQLFSGRKLGHIGRGRSSRKKSKHAGGQNVGHLGATFVGPDVAELLHAATIAVVGEVPLTRLWHAVPSYPTLSEVWLRWLEEYGRPAV